MGEIWTDREKKRDGARTWKQREGHSEGARKTEREKERERERNEGVYTSVRPSDAMSTDGRFRARK